MMKKINISSILVLLIGVLTTSCVNNIDAPVSCGDYYRLRAYDVGVIPKIRRVQILFQVTDCNQQGKSGLDVGDFEIIENGFSMDSEADIRIAPGEIPFSVKTVLLLDITRSVEGLVGQIKTASNSLIDKKLENQEIAIYAFDKSLKLIQDFTTDKTKLKDAIASIPETGLESSTNLYGAIIDLDIQNKWEDIFTVQEISDGSLIVFTDGRHNANRTQTLSMVLESVGNRKVFVAALESGDLDEASLKQVGKTGGYYPAKDISALEAAFIDIQNEITRLSGSIYYLYYTSPISDPTPANNELGIKIFGNQNPSSDKEIVTSFNSEGFN